MAFLWGSVDQMCLLESVVWAVLVEVSRPSPGDCGLLTNDDDALLLEFLLGKVVSVKELVKNCRA